MNIQDLVYDVIVEEVKNKKLFNFLLKKWFGDNPTPEQIQRAENDLTLFTEKQKSLTPKNPAVYSFLLRHDGIRDQNIPAFDPNNLMNIEKYSLEEIESLLHEFRDATVSTGDDDEFKGSLKSDDKKVSASKKLWWSDRDVSVAGEGFKMHYVSDARESIKYGFYQQKMAEKYGGVQWCVTGRNTSDSRSNLWGTYRPKRTFWFVIDESKNPEENKDVNVYKYYLCALQYCQNDQDFRGNRYTGFKMTSMLNDGDNPKTWEEVIKIYPQLAEHRDLFEYVRYDEAELFDRSIANRLTEQEGARYEFAAARRELKKAYLEGGGVISSEKSWKSMDTQLRNLYIISTTVRDVKDKFPSYELMGAIKQVGNEYRLLDKTLRELGGRLDDRGNVIDKELGNLGVGFIYKNLIEQEFIIARSSLDNPSIKLYKSKVNKKKFGLYNVNKIDWVTHDGVKFEPNYIEDSTILYIDDQGKNYLVETYVLGEGGAPDDSSFYCIYPIEDENEMAGGHFVGSRQWAQLVGTKMHPKDENDDEDDDSERFTDLNPETDVDIKETY